MSSLILVSFDDVKWQINDDVIEDGALARLVERASGIVLEEVDSSYPDAWAVANTSPVEYAIPQTVQQVTLALISEMNQKRESEAAVLAPWMIRQLGPWRTPTMSSSPDP